MGSARYPTGGCCEPPRPGPRLAMRRGNGSQRPYDLLARIGDAAFPAYAVASGRVLRVLLMPFVRRARASLRSAACAGGGHWCWRGAPVDYGPIPIWPAGTAPSSSDPGRSTTVSARSSRSGGGFGFPTARPGPRRSRPGQKTRPPRLVSVAGVSEAGRPPCHSVERAPCLASTYRRVGSCRYRTVTAPLAPGGRWGRRGTRPAAAASSPAGAAPA
jgi:hypothetical protein